MSKANEPTDTLRIIDAMTAKELRVIRKKLKLTQQQFADLVGVTRNSIARQERGELGIRESLARLIRVLTDNPAILSKQHSAKKRKR